ncbi:MAG: hypothetical protein HY749_13305 [Gammaproteobacteria bacterium]|nr:hypothetical protein [Gammaproteobacteria bacterium]MBI5616060.1 hypothetical protein [Gammaproteobacteria bacterium]
MALETLGFVAFVLALALAWRWGAPLWMMMRFRFCTFVVEDVDAADVPADAATLLELARPRLEALGFTLVSWQRMSSMVLAEPPQIIHAAEWLHPEHGVWATVGPSETPERGWLYCVGFETFYADAPALFTTDRRRHQYVLSPPGAEHHDDYCGAVETQFANHLARMGELRAGLEPVRDAATARAMSTASLEALPAAFLANGMMQCAESPGLLRFTLRGANAYLRASVAGARRLVKAPLAAPAWNDVPAEDARAGALRALADTRAIRLALAAQRASRDVPGMGAGLLLGSIVAGFGAFAAVIGWKIAALLVLVLLVHESGHYLVMKRLGYRGVRMFFVPLFGALVSGEQAAATPGQLLLLYLAGPLPGLLAGLALVYATLNHHLPVSPTLVTLGVVAIVLNVFNLLPVLPLDGGRVLETLWLARAPRARVAFHAASVVALLALGLLWDSKPLFFIGLLFAFALPRAGRQARLLERVRREHPERFADREQAIGALCQAMAGPEFEKTGYALRFAFVKAHAHEPVAPVPSPATRALGSLVYVAALAAPIALFAHFGIGGTSWLFPSAQRVCERAVVHDWPQEIAAAKDPDRRWQLLHDAGQDAWNGEDETAALGWFERALELSAGFPPGDHRRLESLLKVAETANDPAKSRRCYEEVLGLARPDDPDTALARADALEGLRAVDGEAPSARQLERTREALALREAHQPANHWQVTFARNYYATLLDGAGDAAGAEQQLRRNLDAEANAPGSGDAAVPDTAALRASRVLQQRIGLAWFLVAHARAAEALDVLGPAPVDRAGMEARRHGIARAWALAGTGDPRAALAALDPVLAHVPGNGVMSLYYDLPLFLDRAAFATRAGDAAAAADAEHRITALLAGVPPAQAHAAWTRLAAARGMSGFEAVRETAHRDWIAAHPALAPASTGAP